MKHCASSHHVVFPLSLPSPARGEGLKSPSLDGRGQGEGGFELSSMLPAIERPTNQASEITVQALKDWQVIYPKVSEKNSSEAHDR
jgi:hypothetical protein